MNYQENNKSLIKSIIFQVKTPFLGYFHAIKCTNPTTTGEKYFKQIEA